ncbi:MAG: 2-oxoacid:acceptor oxidoreductase family protein [Bacteriovoracaceae bacterium]|nr:2-oxoacid:acceptor oxidoreductase family protein [Bacteriovoracaceae bacterium]
MDKFRKMTEAVPESKFILQGNAAFALGVVHAGFHAADGYPGTPSTEVIDKSLAKVQDKIQVGWSVNEAVATAVAVGHSLAGYDSVVTMKIPGIFQAGDAISTSAFYTGKAGALVIFVASDYVPSSTQHVIDVRYFFASARLPVLEPRNHQEMYDIAWTAADISKKFNTPVIVLASGILAHSEGLVTTKTPREVTPREIPGNLKDWMLLPPIARQNYNQATQVRIPQIKEWLEGSSELITETKGDNDIGIITCGESDIILKEALLKLKITPSILSLAMACPAPINRIKDFANKIKGKLFIFEDGDQFLQDRIKLNGVEINGKDVDSTITNWTPELICEYLSKQLDLTYNANPENLSIAPLNRPPSICPGCPYRAFGLVVGKLKKQKKIYASFGDIGCSTLLYFMNSLDTVLCMGASDSMRQGFVMSKPDMASQTISIIGDSCECHSGLDSTRNAVFRNVPGVKVILNNFTTAMTGGQPAPSSPSNLEGSGNKFNLSRAVAVENERTEVVNAYDIKSIKNELIKSLELARSGEYTTLILEGECIQEVENSKKKRTLEIDYEKCRKCGSCNICPGIELDEEKVPHFTDLCTNCGSAQQVCLSSCPFGAFRTISNEKSTKKISHVPVVTNASIKMDVKIKDQNTDLDLPDSIRLAIRGVGGQGNLFFGKVLSTLALNTPYAQTHIVKGDTHGMAQLGGPVISTFSCGKVYSPILAPATADVLVAMESGEILRPGFLDLLKPGGTVILNQLMILPPGGKREEYPAIQTIEQLLKKLNLKIIKIDANQITSNLGDTMGKTANVVVLGILSTISPFDKIAEDSWIESLMAVSPNEAIKSANYIAFQEGRKYDQ